MEDRCVMCGEIISEGIQVCYFCEQKIIKNSDKTKEKDKNDSYIRTDK